MVDEPEQWFKQCVDDIIQVRVRIERERVERETGIGANSLQLRKQVALQQLPLEPMHLEPVLSAD